MFIITTSPPLSASKITMFLFCLKEIRASRSVVEIFDLFFRGLAFIMLFSKCLRYKSKAGSLLGLGVNVEGFLNAPVT